MAHAMTRETCAPQPDIDWNASIGAALIAGVIFMIVEMLFAALVHGQSPGTPSRLLAATLMGREVLPPAENFDLTIFSIASLVHFARSLILGALISWTIHGIDKPTSIYFGVALGMAFYVIGFYGVSALFPWFIEQRSWDSFLNYVMFGGATGWLYTRFCARRHAGAA